MAVADWVVQEKECTQYVSRYRLIVTIMSAFAMKIAKILRVYECFKANTVH